MARARKIPCFISLTCRKTRVERQGRGAALLLVAAFLACMAPASARAARSSDDILAHVNPGRTDNAADSYAEARELLAKRKWPEAAVVLQKIHREYPSSQAALLDLVKALVYGGRREEALAILNQVAGREKGSRKAVVVNRVHAVSRTFLTNATFQSFESAFQLLKEKKYRPARERFEKVLETEPDNVEVLLRIGQCLVMENDFDSAAERLRYARKLNPHEPEIRLWLGRALHQRGELEFSIEELRYARENLPRSELAPIWLAEALSLSGLRAAAYELLESDARTEPLHVMSLVTLAQLRLAGSAKDTAAAWAVRKDLQVALSRFDRYAAPGLTAFEGELGLNLRDPAELKTRIESLLQRVNGKLEKTEESS